MFRNRLNSRRATTRIEALIFLILFCLASLAAWALWRKPIQQTNEKLVERAKSFVTSEPARKRSLPHH